MKIRRHLGKILLATCLSQLLAIGSIATDTQLTNTNASNNTTSKDDQSTQKELLQLQLGAQKELLQKDIEAQATRIDAFEKRMDDQTSRISDIGSGVDILSLTVGLFGLLITVLLVGIGFWGYKTAKNDAKETAKEAASQWFNDNHITLASQIKELELRVTQAIKSIDDHEAKVVQRSSEAHAKMETSAEELQEQIQNIQNQISQHKIEEKSAHQPTQDNYAIEQKAEQLKQLPETEYTFNDWNTRAFAAYSEGKFESAVFYWDKAISSLNIQPQNQAQTIYNKGIVLSQLNRSEEAIATYNEVIAKFGTAEELDLREQVALSMFNKGVTLAQLNRAEEAIEAYDEIITKFGTAKEFTLHEKVAKAMINKGITLEQLKRNHEAIEVYDAIIAKFEIKEEGILCESVARAMVYKGIALNQLNRPEESLAVYNTVIEKFFNAGDFNLREQVANAMASKGTALFNLNRYEEAVAAYDAVVTKFDTEKELKLPKQVANAIANKGTILIKLNRYKEAIATFDVAIAKFNDAEESTLRKQVSKAWNGKGFTLICMAKANWENGALAKDFLENAYHACNQCLTKDSDLGLAFGNLAYITWLQGDAIAAENHFRAGLYSITNGGENLYKITLTDFEIHPIEPDQGFRELVEKLWTEYQHSH